MKRYRTKDLEAMRTEQLANLLRAEMDKQVLNDQLIRNILQILRQREPAQPVELTDDQLQIWKDHEARFAGMKERAHPERGVERRKHITWISAVAASVCLAIFALPPVFGANNVIDLINRLASGEITFFHPGNAHEGYVFETDHPGLQQVYDAVIELGVTDPVVPMWLPDGYELVELKTSGKPSKLKMLATFMNGEEYVVLSVEITSFYSPITIEANQPDYQTVDLEGSVYYITENEKYFTVLWGTENYSCSLHTSVTEDVCHDILRSIHRRVVYK